MRGRSKLLTIVAMWVALYWSLPVAAQDSQKDVDQKTLSVARAEVAMPRANAPAAPSAMASEEEVTELKTEMRQLRTLVEEQQALITKLKGGSPSSSEGSPVSAASTPAPAPAPVPQPIQEENPEQAIRPFKIGGFGAWSFGKSNNVNEYDLATYHGRYDNIDAGLIVTLGITPTVNATAQISFQSADDHTETDVDFAFIDWKLSDRLTIKAGQAKNPFGLYSEYLGIGTLYPFNDVPQGIYGGTSIGNEFYRGFGVSGRAFAKRKWEMDYDFFGGGSLNDELNPAERINEAVQAGQSTASIESESEEIHQAFGGRLTLARPDDGFRIGINGNTGISPDKGRHTVLGAFAAYDSARWLLHSEFGHSFEPGFIHFSAAYLEAGYKITRHWQPVFRYDWARQGLVSPVAIPDSYKSHREVGGGLNYWITPKAVIKGSYHHVNGNLLAVPRGDLDLTTLNDVPKTTDLGTIGVAFVF
jgi:hypothetical protein